MEQPKLLFEGKYEILAKIREGGMGTIYRVRHRLLDEVRVVKVLRPHVVADADLKRRFLEEAKTAIRLKHDNLCTIHDFAADESGTAYIVMEFIGGANLADLLKARGPLDTSLTMQIGHQALLALGYLHRKSVIHRDVAPDNLMLTHDEDRRPVVKLIDLGIAKAVNRMDMTATGVFLGKLKYASPEQFGALPAGEKIDGRSDLYGLGVVLYELLTGIRPFKGESPAELLRAHMFTAPIPFEESDREGRVPPELRALILRALEKKREDRFATAEDFDRELLTLADRYRAPRDRENTAAFLATVRETQPTVSDSITPSAQDRLDLNFGNQTTPSPTAPPLMIVPLRLEAVGAPIAASPPRSPEKEGPSSSATRAPSPKGTAPVDRDEIEIDLALPPRAAPPGLERKVPVGKPEGTSPAKPEKPAARPDIRAPEPPAALKSPGATTVPSAQKPAIPTPATVARAPVEADSARAAKPGSRARPRLALAIVAAAALLLWLWRPWAAHRTAVEQIAAAPSPLAQAPVQPTARPAPSPAPTSIPTAAPTAAPTARPVTPVDTRARELTDAARTAAVAARNDADQARAGELAPTMYRRAFERYSLAARLAARGADGEAKRAYEAASALYRDAATAARAQAYRPPTPAPVRIAEVPTAILRPAAAPLVPTLAPPPEATAAPPERKPPSPPAIAPRSDIPGASEAREQITKVVGDYAWAQTTQDERLFVQVFPAGIENFKLTFKNLKTQNVRLDIRSIDLEGARAVVSAHEVVVAKPRAGDEVRNEANVTLQLEKQGDHWVIVSRR